MGRNLKDMADGIHCVYVGFDDVAQRCCAEVSHRRAFSRIAAIFSLTFALSVSVAVCKEFL